MEGWEQCHRILLILTFELNQDLIGLYPTYSHKKPCEMDSQNLNFWWKLFGGST